MPRNQNRKNHVSSTKREQEVKKSWLHLPQQLVGLTEGQRHQRSYVVMLENRIYWQYHSKYKDVCGCVIKSWRSPSKKCNRDEKDQYPQLVQIPQDMSHKYGRSYSSIRPDSQTVPLELPDLSENCCPWEREKKCTCLLPPKDEYLFVPNRWCDMKLTNDCCHPFISPSSLKIHYDASSSGGSHLQFTNIIGLERKYYALTLQGSLIVMDDIDRCFRIAAVGRERVVPSGVSRQFREYLFQSDGKILLIFLISRKSINVVDDVEVLRLDVNKLVWVKVESFGGSTFFFDEEYGVEVTRSEEVGCKKNCIYFTHDKVNKWFVYEMVTRQISPASGTC